MSPCPGLQQAPLAALGREKCHSLLPSSATWDRCSVVGGKKRPMLGPHQDPHPGTLSPRSETDSHQAASWSCVVGTAVALEWNPLATARLTGHEQCSYEVPPQGGWQAPPRDFFREKGGPAPWPDWQADPPTRTRPPSEYFGNVGL